MNESNLEIISQNNISTHAHLFLLYLNRLLILTYQLLFHLRRGLITQWPTHTNINSETYAHNNTHTYSLVMIIKGYVSFKLIQIVIGQIAFDFALERAEVCVGHVGRFRESLHWHGYVKEKIRKNRRACVLRVWLTSKAI